MVTLEDVKKHCRVEDDDADSIELLQKYLDSAIDFAEQYQTKVYTGDEPEQMSAATQQAVRLLVSFWFDNRDESYNLTAHRTENKTMAAVKNLLYFERSLRI